MNYNITGDKMFGWLDRVVADYKKPITADVFLTNYCNNKCPYCTYGRWELEAGKRAMTFEAFRMYAERMIELGIQGIILTGGGEPTLCPDFEAICRWMDKKKIHYGINTNFNRLAFPKPDFLKVSLDGWDEDSYEKSRGVRKYKQTVENIKTYTEWKVQNSPGTSVGVQRVCENAEDVYRFYEANRGLDVDYFSFRPVESTGGEYYQTDEAKWKAEEIITAVKQLATADARVLLNYKWNMLHYREKACAAQWAQLAVNECGEVMYCCQKPYEIVGHIFDDDILERKRDARTDMEKCDIPCRMCAPNKFVRESRKERKDKWFI